MRENRSGVHCPKRMLLTTTAGVVYWVEKEKYDPILNSGKWNIILDFAEVESAARVVFEVLSLAAWWNRKKKAHNKTSFDLLQSEFAGKYFLGSVRSWPRP